ncbi:hypothetical protein LQ757_18885 [Agromyces sp. SYSU K20354]|uniref:hypothetical protein n=1 Tax=Agromyces cavernae TaxID=2898659 RepID=UPI001E57DF00|nr:hypothetical protein [Agromyces cavernae]MCD2444351.1 hypothetical protein [Agromyces cavernae]
MQRMSGALLVALILLGVLVLCGALLVVVSSQASVSFGWFAYQPLSDSVFVPGSFVVLTQPAVVGAAVTVVGLIGLGAVAGYALGRRGRVAE